jgi:hypothetical protein
MKNQQTMKKMKQLIKTFVPVDIVYFSQNKQSAYVNSCEVWEIADKGDKLNTNMSASS